jgi:hypothetical protein
MLSSINKFLPNRYFVICIETNHVCIICAAKVDIKSYSTHFLISIESSGLQSQTAPDRLPNRSRSAAVSDCVFQNKSIGEL